MANDVRSYQRRTKDGRVITVQAYERDQADAADAAERLPGRPPMAARTGTFAGGRSMPGVFLSPQPPPGMPAAPGVLPGMPDQKASPEQAKAAAKLADTLKDHPAFAGVVEALKKVAGGPS